MEKRITTCPRCGETIEPATLESHGLFYSRSHKTQSFTLMEVITLEDLHQIEAELKEARFPTGFYNGF